MSVRTTQIQVVAERAVKVAGRTVHILGNAPKNGSLLTGRFSIPAARNATEPLTERALARGLVIVSTLPNIENHACAMQVVHLEEHAVKEFPSARLVHVSSDEPEYWDEVDEYHGDLQAAGYTLADADPESRASFCRALGVGVRESHRVAHGLFAIKDGVFLATEVPDDQMDTPDVHSFLHHLRAALLILEPSPRSAPSAVLPVRSQP